MENSLNLIFDTSNQAIVTTCLILAVFRLYLEVIGYDFSQLPLTKLMSKNSPQQGESFHKMGLYLSVGYILLFAPGLLL
jgi:hypothetical protein